MGRLESMTKAALIAEVKELRATIHKLEATSVVSDIPIEVGSEHLHRTLNLLSQAEELGKVGGWQYETATEQSEWTDNMYRLCGYSPDTPITHDFFIEHIVHPDDKAVISNLFQSLFTEKRPIAVDFKIIRKDGQERLLHGKVVPQLDKAGEVKSVYGVNLDITDQQKAVAHIQDLARFPSENPNPVIRVSVDGIVLYANGAATPLLDGLCSSDGKALSSIGRELLLAESQSIEGGIEYECENRTYHLSVIPIPASDYVNVYGMDITERKSAESELREREEQFRMHYQIGLVGMVQVNLDKSWTSFNDKFCEIVGYEREELETMQWPSFTHPDDVDENKRLFEEILAGKRDSYSMSKRYVRKDGQIVYATIYARTIHNNEGEPKYVVTHIMDITELVTAEKELRRNLSESMALARLYAPIVAPKATIQSTATVVLEEAQKLTGSKHGYVGTINGNGALEIHIFSTMMEECAIAAEHKKIVFPKDEKGQYPALWGHCLNVRKAHFVNKVHDHPASKGAPEGHVKLENLLSVPVMLGDQLVGQIALANRPDGYSEGELQIAMRLADYFALAVQRVRSEEALMASRDLMQSILTGIGAGIIQIDPKTQTIERVNDVALKMLGGPEEAYVGKLCDAFCWKARDDNGKLNCPIEGNEVVQKEMTLKRYAGTNLPIQKTVLSETIDGKEKFLEIIFDISERKELERRLNLAQKLESIGQLSAGIAHEINTPAQYLGDNLKFFSGAFDDILNFAKGYESICSSTQAAHDSELCMHVEKMWKDTDMDYLTEEIPHALTQSLEGIRRIASIVKAMKQFSHPGIDLVKHADINAALENTVTVCRNEWKYHSKVVFELSPDIPLLSCYINDLNQAFLNIIVNAAHAITNKVANTGELGVITVRTWLEEPWIAIEIEDTGTGIPADILPKIFDPFFTTKDVGVGTGQGLSLCYAIIVDKHGGTIDFTSEPGVGTRCSIRLPLGTPGEG